MTDREILSNAIDKAIANGWSTDNLMIDKIVLKQNLLSVNHPSLSSYVRGIIFSHSFAKAFWGEKRYLITELTELTPREIDFEYSEFFKFDWQWYLQQMVLEKNPIKYLERFL